MLKFFSWYMCIFVFLFFLNDVFFFYLPWNMSFITDFAQLSWEFLFLSERITTLSWNKECLHSLSNKVKFNLCFLLSVHRSFLGDLLCHHNVPSVTLADGAAVVGHIQHYDKKKLLLFLSRKGKTQIHFYSHFIDQSCDHA